jgi:hypothetical protein
MQVFCGVPWWMWDGSVLKHGRYALEVGLWGSSQPHALIAWGARVTSDDTSYILLRRIERRCYDLGENDGKTHDCMICARVSCWP